MTPKRAGGAGRGRAAGRARPAGRSGQAVWAGKTAGKTAGRAGTTRKASKTSRPAPAGRGLGAGRTAGKRAKVAPPAKHAAPSTTRLRARRPGEHSEPTRVHLNRAMSKLGILTRSQATAAILAGHVSVNGRIVRDPATAVDLHKATITVDGTPAETVQWRTVLFNKPRGVVTTRHDPEGRPTVYDALGESGAGLVPVGRLDLPTSGLLLMTTDTALLEWVTNPDHGVSRVYVVTVRGSVTAEEASRLEAGVTDGRDELRAAQVTIRKTSGRESHLTIELREGKNREVRSTTHGRPLLR